MRIHWIVLVLLVVAGCSAQGEPSTGASKKTALETGKQFAEALVAKRYSDAHSMLTAELQPSWPVKRLRSRFEEMVSCGSGPIIVDGHTEHLDKWPGRRSGDLGWVYVSISGSDFGEAITVIVADDRGEPRIREIEWGRP